MFLDEDARSLRASQAQYVAPQLWPGVDWWDHIFRTYKPVEWPTDQELNQPQRGYLELKWR